ncbi:toxic anion resistance protein [Porcincola intestinalis]|uniref:toxic anion resistance protein n=1 Tax=Porcincola intestinalis TaxID=2606632 RepID=UPI002A7FDC35|nr:toxic anion resistance protein [Porcincola intestinalis]MDY4204135.1 toxic anion resistance protein [Porcincola intestinalis]
MLTPEEQKEVEQRASEIDIEDVDSIINYGAEAQKNISDFSISILKQVRTLDLGDMGKSLKDLTVALDATVEPEKKGIFGVFQKAKRNVDVLKANFVKAENNVDKIEKDLQAHRTILSRDISMYQDMYVLNLKYYKELTVYIIAGKKALADARNNKLVALKQEADSTQKQEDAQAYKDYEDLCARFGKKLNDMELTRMISIQTAPQVRMLQNNDREMLDKIQSSLANTIPLWRNQLVLTLGIEHSRRAIDAQSQLTDKTNDLLRQNASTLRMATVDAARESERPIVEIETLRQCNRDLIASINDVVKIHEQGSEKRVQIHDELIRLEDELKQTMLQQSKR